MCQKFTDPWERGEDAHSALLPYRHPHPAEPQEENVLWIRPTWVETPSATHRLCDLGRWFNLTSISSTVKRELQHWLRSIPEKIQRAVQCPVPSTSLVGSERPHPHFSPCQARRPIHPSWCLQDSACSVRRGESSGLVPQILPLPVLLFRISIPTRCFWFTYSILPWGYENFSHLFLRNPWRLDLPTQFNY